MPVRRTWKYRNLKDKADICAFYCCMIIYKAGITCIFAIYTIIMAKSICVLYKNKQYISSKLI